jgi:hypothetical protein
MASPVLVNGYSGVSSTPIFVRSQSDNVLGYHIFNASNATAFVQFYDTQAAPTVGTTVAVWCIGIPTLTHAFLPFQVAGLYFSSGIWIAATTTASGSGAPSAALTVNLAMS